MRRRLALLTTLALTTALSACSGSSMDDPAGPAKELTVGLLVPQTGPYKTIGDDQLRAWQLYLDRHGGKLGGHPIKTVIGDEGEGEGTTRTAADKLLKADRVSVIVGTATAPAVKTIEKPVTEAKIPFIGAGGRPSTLADVSYIWHTSFQSADYGRSIGKYLAQNAGGPVYVIGPKYQGGEDQIGGFVDAFTAAGGKLANPGGQPAWTPWPATENFGPWLSKIKETGAKGVYTFYAGGPAIGFVKQYKQFGLGGIPLYGAGFLTEGAALTNEGAAADGVYTTSNYVATLDNPANKTFVAAYTARFQAPPNVYNLTMWDAAALLDKAIAVTGANPSPQAINDALGKMGQLDSPRGTWSFAPATHTPVQRWYLRQVRPVDGKLSNVVVADLGTV